MILYKPRYLVNLAVVIRVLDRQGAIHHRAASSFDCRYGYILTYKINGVIYVIEVIQNCFLTFLWYEVI